MRRTLIGLCVWALLLTAAVPGAGGQDRAALIEEGRAAFTRVGCSNCHRVSGAGAPIAADLSRVGAKHGVAYLERWLRDPRDVHPSGHMPAIELNEADIRALAAYLAAQR